MKHLYSGNSRFIWHGLVWSIYLVPIANWLFNLLHWQAAALALAGHVLPIMLLIYFNLYQLLPKYLIHENRTTAYIVRIVPFLLLVSAFVTFWQIWSISNYTFSENSVAVLFIKWGKSLVALTVMVALTSGLKLGKQWWLQRKRLKNIELEKAKAEVKFLRAQLNPHFLFNTLNNLYALALQQSAKTPDMILKLAGLMEYIMYSSQQESVSLEKEISFLENYIALEKLRLPVDSKIRFNIQGKINGQGIAPLLFLPFVENGFKHGFTGNRAGNYLKIDIRVQAKNLEFSMENKLRTNLKNGSGIGLENSTNRLKLMYPEKHHLNINQEKETYRVELKLELR
ncbi:MAG: histidine kinase [Bacteroidia bacterium]